MCPWTDNLLVVLETEREREETGILKVFICQLKRYNCKAAVWPKSGANKGNTDLMNFIILLGRFCEIDLVVICVICTTAFGPTVTVPTRAVPSLCRLCVLMEADSNA